MNKEQVPYLTESAVHLAHLCALETWRGYSYSNGKQFTDVIAVRNKDTKTNSTKLEVLSDEYFMSRCTEQMFSVLKPNSYSNNAQINDSFIEAFRKVAGIKQTERRGPKPNYTQGVAYLKRGVAEDYKNYHKLSIVDKPLGVLKAINNLSVAFTDQTEETIQSEHVMLATRLLFFFMPDALIFNYSPGIAMKLKLKGDAEKHIDEYQIKLWEGLKLNWKTLCHYDMPLPKNVDEATYQLAKNSGWWQRRIYDLALKFYGDKNSSLVLSHKIKTSLLSKPNLIV